MPDGTNATGLVATALKNGQTALLDEETGAIEQSELAEGDASLPNLHLGTESGAGLGDTGASNAAPGAPAPAGGT
ncbi:MAG: hypothetical protein FJX67_11375, partial [Alphaproteobacteria bacterium]|nr:hypothetical protein [Alphaproteobacteria bacterium]